MSFDQNQSKSTAQVTNPYRTVDAASLQSNSDSNSFATAPQ